MGRWTESQVQPVFYFAGVSLIDSGIAMTS